MPSLSRLPQVALVLSAAIWASHNIAGFWLTTSIHPYLANLLRSTLASLLFLPFVMTPVWRRARLRGCHMHRLLIAALCMGTFFLLFYIALSQTSANHVAILLCLGPALTTLLAVPYLGERLTRRQVGGILLAMCSALMVGLLNQGSVSATGTWLGAAAAMGAMLGFSHYTLLSKPLLSFYPAPVILGILTWIATALLWIGTLFVPGFDLGQLRGLGTEHWLVLLYIALAMNVLSYLLYNYALQRLTAGTTHAVTVYTTTVFALIMARFILGEAVSAWHWACAILIGVGVWMTAGASAARRSAASSGAPD